jgi:hypothetical protein
MEDLRKPALFYRPNITLNQWIRIPRFHEPYVALSKVELGAFVNNLNETYNTSNVPTTSPKPLYGAGDHAHGIVLSYVPPGKVDNHNNIGDIEYDTSGNNGWEVLLREHSKMNNINNWTLGQLKEEFKRRGLSFKNTYNANTALEMIENDIEETGEEEPDWSNRPPTEVTLFAGELEVLREELKQDVMKATEEAAAEAAAAKKNKSKKRKKKREIKRPTLATGWYDCAHANDCFHGDECVGPEGGTRLFSCYYCLYCECGPCCGLSARQTVYTGTFVCSSCREVAASGAIALSASTIEIEE